MASSCRFGWTTNYANFHEWGKGKSGSRTGLQARLVLPRPDEERAWRPVLHGEKNARRSRLRWRARSVKSNPIGVNRCFSSDILVGCSRHLQPQVDGICVPIWLDHELTGISRMGQRGQDGKDTFANSLVGCFFSGGHEAVVINRGEKSG